MKFDTIGAIMMMPSIKCSCRSSKAALTSSLAFSVNPKLVKSKSKDLVLPVYWEDNYFSLLPGEKRSMKVEFSEDDQDGEKPVLMVEGWNIHPGEIEIE